MVFLLCVAVIVVMSVVGCVHDLDTFERLGAVTFKPVWFRPSEALIHPVGS